MLRRILAVAAGLVAFLALVAAFDGLASLLFPLPPSADPNNPDSFRPQLANVAAAALAIVLTGSTLAAIAGTYVTALLLDLGDVYWPFITGAIGLIATLANALTVPHPVWFVVAAPLGVIGGAGLAVWLASRRRGSGAARAPAKTKQRKG
jgi:hypothetical protein